MSRTKQEIANIQELQKLLKTNGVTDHRPIIAYVMKHCGATMREVGEVFGVTRQQAETIYKNAQERADNHYEV